MSKNIGFRGTKMKLNEFTVYNPYNNQTVTSFYVEIIAEALKNSGYNVVMRDHLTISESNYGILIVTPKDYHIAKKMCYRHIILWQQGLPPEESFMRNHSYLRKWIISLRDYQGLKHSDLIFMVSQQMRVFLTHKYHIDFGNRTFFMPCFNSVLDPSAFSAKDKYTQNTFVYTGSLAKWQCFEQTVQVYKQLEKVLDNSRFDVYTSDQKEARRLLEKYQVKNYSLDFVSPAELTERLKQAKYGFVLREDNPVNNVATPTKFSTYLASGVIPIFSSCIYDFYETTKNMKNMIAIEDFDIEKIVKHSKLKIDASKVYEEFKCVFDTYYNRDDYIEKIVVRIRELLGVKPT